MGDSSKRQALEAVFNQFDKDGSGKIDSSELKQAVTTYYSEEGIQADQAQINDDVQAILATCDSSKDGKIDKNEWFKFFEC